MKHYLTSNLAKVLLVICSFMSVSPIWADEDDKHELENLHVTIPATEFKSSQFLDKEVIKGKTYIKGKSSSYNKKGEANAKTLLQPNAEYVIKSKLPGGTYNVTVFYVLDEKEMPEKPMISVGMNMQKAQHLEIEKKLINSVKASFKVNFIKGKQHTLKIWFPSEGVKVREIRIARALLPKKKDKE